MNRPLASGTWHLVGDGLIYEPVDMRFDVLRRADGNDAVLATFQHHFDPPTDPVHRFDAVPYEADAVGTGLTASPGEFLVLRFAVESNHPPGTKQYVPNGDGENHAGRIPSLRLPR